MDLTPENKAYIDSLAHYQLLSEWRFAPAGDPWLEGETGKYWGERLAEMRARDNTQAVHDSRHWG